MSSHYPGLADILFFMIRKVFQRLNGIARLQVDINAEHYTEGRDLSNWTLNFYNFGNTPTRTCPTRPFSDAKKARFV